MRSGIGAAVSSGAPATFVVSSVCEYSTDAVAVDAATVPFCERDGVTGSDCASATTKDGSIHIDLTSELSRSTVITNTAITAAKRYRIKLPSMCVNAGRIEVGCGHFADELRQRRVFWPVVLPRRLEVTGRRARCNIARDNSQMDEPKTLAVFSFGVAAIAGKPSVRGMRTFSYAGRSRNAGSAPLIDGAGRLDRCTHEIRADSVAPIPPLKEPKMSERLETLKKPVRA